VINKERADALVSFAKEVQKYAKASESENPSAVHRENRRRAWVLLKQLNGYAEQLAESDIYHAMSTMPAKTPADRRRCETIALNERVGAARQAKEFIAQAEKFSATPAKQYLKDQEDEQTARAAMVAAFDAKALRQTSAKKPAAKPAAKKPAAKPVARKAAAKPTTKKAGVKPVAKKAGAKPVAKKGTARATA
jgi:hypothetical protein